jgi:serine/threonine-protein kinase
MAELFKACAHGPGGYRRTLVIKRALPKLGADPEVADMLAAEARLLGLLRHPNIVQIYDYDAVGAGTFLALEFLDGPSVAALLTAHRRARRPVPVAAAAYIAREVCLGLAAAHALADADGLHLGVVHRDVTPGNVMTTTSGEVKLVDFGIARTGLGPQHTRDGTFRGKPAYVAPEQMLGGAIDGRADVFSAGVVLHELLTLEPLFQGTNDVSTIYRVLEHPVSPPSSLRPEVPPALDQVVLRALERPPRRRFRSAADMAAALSAILGPDTEAARSSVAAMARQAIEAALAARPHGATSRKSRPPTGVTV